MARNSKSKQTESEHNRVTSSIVRLFPNQTILSVLSELLINSDTEYYQSELVNRTGDTLLQVQRALHRIEDAGFVTKRRRGNRVYYLAAKHHPAFTDLRQFLIKTTGLCDSLREALVPISDNVEISFIFGSIAAGSETADSDIDILLIGDVSLRKISGILRPVGRELGREFNSVIFPRAEFRKKAKAKNRFIGELLKSSKIWLIGSNDDLRKMVK